MPFYRDSLGWAVSVRLKALIFVYAAMLFRNEQEMPQPKTTVSISVCVCVYIYTSLIEVKFLEIECCFVFFVGQEMKRKKGPNNKHRTSEENITSRKTNSYMCLHRRICCAKYSNPFIYFWLHLWIHACVCWLVMVRVRSFARPRLLLSFFSSVLIFFLCFVKYLRIWVLFVCLCVALQLPLICQPTTM